MKRALAGRGRDYRFGLALAVGLLIVAGAIGVQAFTLIFNVYLDPVSPPQGTAAGPIVVEGGVMYGACPSPAVTFTFDFYFDKGRGGPVIWTTKTGTCSAGKVDTGPSPALTPPAALAGYGQHTIELDVLTAAGVLAGQQPTQTYSVVPSLALDPTCGSAGDPITVRGAGFAPRFPVTISFTPPAGGKPDASATPGVDGAFAISVAVPQRPAGSYTVVAAQDATQFAAGQLLARAAFTVPCLKAAIVLKPTVGPPGTVVTVTGTGFPNGAAVKLSWSQGIAIAVATIMVGSSQGFQLALLIFPHDQLGARRMSATPDLSVSGAPIFNIATADFLVVPGTEQPRDFSWRH